MNICIYTMKAPAPILPETVDNIPPFVQNPPNKKTRQLRYRDDAFMYERYKICFACCCFHMSCIPPSWECVGCTGRSECICCIQECCFTMDTEPFLCCDIPDDQCCRIGLCCYGIALKTCPPETCCKNHIQFCPCVLAGAFPTDTDIPCACTICCCTVYPEVGWGFQVRELNGRLDKYAVKTNVYVHPQQQHPVKQHPVKQKSIER